jgi:hypothetical protein
MPVNKAYRCAELCGLDGQTMINVFGYQQMSGNSSGDTDQVQLGKAFENVILAAQVNTWADQVSYGFLEIRELALPGDPIVGIDYAFTPGTGTVEEPSVPPAVAVVIRRRTSFLGRKYRGRVYCFGCPQSMVVNGALLPTTGGHNQFAALATLMEGTIVSGDPGAPTFRPVLVAKDATVVGGDNPGWRVTPITSCVVDDTLRSQRRRQLGVGV